MHLLSADSEPITVHAVRKQYGDVDVLRGIDLVFRRSEATAIVGPNGAGKTTLIKCLLGLVRPGSGRIEVGGEDVAGTWAYRELIGYMPQEAAFPDHLTVRDVIGLIRSLRRGEADLSMVHALGLDAEMDKPVRTLSGGTRQKLGAAVAFLFDAPILVLDEPTAGLDPVAAGVLKERVRRRREAGATVLLTSHVMADLEELADRVVFLLDGRVQFDGTLDEIRHRTGEARLERAIAQMLKRDAA